MSRIAAEELPSPVATQAVQVPQVGWAPQADQPAQVGWAPLAPAPAPTTPPARRSGVALIGGLAVVAAGVFGFLQLRDDDTSSAGTTTVAVNASGGNGAAGNSGVTPEQLGDAFTYTFGTTADAATLSCLTQQIGTEGGQAARLAQGEVLTYAEAQQAFVPFVACATDADFVGQLLTPTVGLYANGADAECIALGLADFDVNERANALALAFTQPGELGNELFNYFTGCAF